VDVCVFCASSRRLDRRWLDLAGAVGAALAARGHRVVSGGGCVGMMGTLAEAARGGGAHTLGVIPQSLVDREVADTRADELVITDGLAARKIVLMERAQAFLVLPGGIGTLDELFEVWTTAVLGLHRKPIVLLDVDGFYRGLLAWLSGTAALGFVPPEALAMLHVIGNLEEALDAIEQFR
jgi:uncharacterized protein (TIGR00730 family)